MRGYRTAIVFALGCCLVSRAADVEATGFFVEQQSVQGLGRAQAGAAAAATDASTIFFNPAGMTRLNWSEIDVGTHVLFPAVRFKDRGSTAATPGTLGAAAAYGGNSGGNPGSPTPVPNLYAAIPLWGKELWGGIGVSFPFGLGAKYDSDWFGRYDSIESRLTTIDIAPSIAYRFNPVVSVGAGLDIQYADAKLSSAIPDTLRPGGPTAATDGLFRLKGDGLALGYNVGILLEPTADTRIGIHYRSAIRHELDGTARVSGLSGPLALGNEKQKIKSTINLPDIVSIGVAYEASPKWTLLAGTMWSGWSRFEDIRIEYDDGRPDLIRFENYKDTVAFSLGAEYHVTNSLVGRAGVQYDMSPTRDRERNTSLPDGNRYWIAIGATYAVADRLEFDLSYKHVFFDTGRVNIARSFFDGLPAAGTVIVQGDATTDVDTVSLNARYRF